MMRELQLLELQEKRMRKLVEQRREERKGLELENSRMQRQKNTWRRWRRKMKTGRKSTAARWQPRDHLVEQDTCPAPAQAPARTATQVQPVVVDSTKPVGNVQVCGYSDRY